MTEESVLGGGQSLLFEDIAALLQTRDDFPPLAVEPDLMLQSSDEHLDPSVLVVPSSDVSSVPSPDSGSSSNASSSDPAPIAELLTLIDWKNNERSGPKRVRGSSEKAHEKHVMMEKKRRGDLTSAIEEINTLVPPAPAAASSSAKRSKVATLQDAAEYLKRVQDVAVALIAENKRLQASLQENPPALYNTASRSRPALQGQEVVRLFMISAFLVWMFIGVPTPWTDSSSFSFSSRALLNVNAEDATAACYRGIAQISHTVIRVLTVFVAFVVVWVCIVLQDMPRISADQLRAAEAHMRDVETAMEQNSNLGLAMLKHAEAMSDLKKPLPSSRFGDHLFFAVQLIRALFNLLYVGLFIERYLMRWLGRQETVLLETKAYMYGAKLNVLNRTKKMPVTHYFGCVLAAASNINACGAPIAMRDELCVGMAFMDTPKNKRKINVLIHRTIMALAEAQTNTVVDDMPDNEISEWTLLRTLAGNVNKGKFEDALTDVLEVLPRLKGSVQAKVVGAAGMVAFCLQRYEAAFLMMSTGLKMQGTTGYAVRKVVGTMLICLYKMGLKTEAKRLLPSYEGTFLCVPNARTNLLPVERFFLYCARIICADSDFVAIITHTREMLTVVDLMGMQKFFNLPFIIEIALERLFAALQLANEAAGRARTDPTEIFVVHQRGEINDMAESIINLLTRCSYSAAFIYPIVERVKGWHALLSNDRSAASYHLNRSLLEARRWQLPGQEETTEELMKFLGVPVLQETKTKDTVDNADAV